MVRIPDSEIENTLSVSDYLDSCDEAFRLYGEGALLSPAREERIWREEDSDVFQLVMPAHWAGRYRAKKTIREQSNVSEGRLGDRSAILEIEDLVTGNLFELDAEYITNMRTGAAGVLGGKYLGPEDIRLVSIIGTGRIAEALARCADAAFGPDVIRVTSRRLENRIRFKELLEGDVEARVEIVDSIPACLEGSDAVFTSVPTPQPVLGEDLGREVHLSVIAGDPRTSQLEPGLIWQREIVVDHAEQAAKSGDFLSAAGTGKPARLSKDQEGKIFTIGDAALGRLAERRGEGLVAYFTGMALQDLHAGVALLKKLGLIRPGG